MVEDGLFDVPSRPAASAGDGRISDQRLLEHLRSFVAPIAADAGAVVDDPRALEMARDLAEAFADHPGVSGMTKAEVQAAIARRRPVDAALFEARFELFVRMGLIRPFLEKKHQPRYVLDPAGMAGLLVFERLGATGGVDEMIMLLDRTRWLIGPQVLLCPDADLGGVRIAAAVLDALPAAAVPRVVICDPGEWPHRRQPPWPADGATVRGLRERLDGPAAQLAGACLARGYRVEQEDTVRAAVGHWLSTGSSRPG